MGDHIHTRSEVDENSERAGKPHLDLVVAAPEHPDGRIKTWLGNVEGHALIEIPPIGEEVCLRLDEHINENAIAIVDRSNAREGYGIDIIAPI